MKRLQPLVFAALTLTAPFAAHATNYAVQPASTLGFASNFQGTAFNGHFDHWTATIHYDPGQLASSAFDVTVDLASVKTGDKDRDGALPGKDFFDIAQFPQAHFVTTAFHQSGGQVVADGNLTLRGVTKPVHLIVTFKPQGNTATLDVSGSLKRLDFGVGGGDYADTSVIGPDVKITAHLLLIAK